MWILLAITMLVATDQVQTTQIRKFSVSDMCQQARQLLQDGQAFDVDTTSGRVTHFVCLKRG